MKTSLRNLCISVFFSLSGVYAQVQVIPQVADGGGWATTIVLTNTTATAQTAVLKFNQSTGATGATSPWTPPFNESVTLNAISLPAGATLFLHTPGTAATLTQGWGELTAVAGIEGYAIFTSHAPGNPAQDATAPAGTASTRILVPFDNTSHLLTAVALVNPNATAETVLVNIKTSEGAVSNGTLPSLPAKGQKTFLMATAYPETVGKSGLAEFYTNSGTISSIALRANPSGAFTSAPVYSESGPPVIGGISQPIGIFSKLAAREFLAATQRLIIPQVADGDGWKSTIVLINTSANAQLITLKFNQRVGLAGATIVWNPPFTEGVSLTNLSIPAASAMFLHTPGSAATLTQGWGELDADPSVVGYAIFTSAAPGNPAQDATALASLGATRILMPFDNTSGFIAAVAAANSNFAASASILVNIRTSDGVTSTGTLASLPANGQATFLMPTQFPGTAGKSGLAEFYVNSGSFSIIALRANPSGAFTAAPVYFETGAPIISTGGGTAGKIINGGFAISKTMYSIQGDHFEIESMSGAFSAYTQTELDAHHGTQVGACFISDYTYDPNTKGPADADATLDAGVNIQASGPHLGPGTVLASQSGPTGPTYSKSGLTSGTLDNGTYTLTGNGGTEIGPFTVSGPFPDNFAVTNFDSFTSINRATPLTISWTGEGFSMVNIVLASGHSTATTSHNVFISCQVPASPATFTVPTIVLGYLIPIAQVNGTDFGLLEVGASNQVEFTAKVIKTGANIDSGFLDLNWAYLSNPTIH